PERQIELGESPRHQRGFGRGGAARGEAALGRFHGADDVAVASHGEMSGEFTVVRPLARGHAVEVKIIAADRHRLSGLKFRNPLEAPFRLPDYPPERDPEPEMRKGGAPRRTRRTAPAR